MSKTQTQEKNGSSPAMNEQILNPEAESPPRILVNGASDKTISEASMKALSRKDSQASDSKKMRKDGSSLAAGKF